MKITDIFIAAKRLLILTVLLLSPHVAQAEKLILSAFNYPPYMDESMPTKGVFCELVSAAFEAAGYNVVYQFHPLSRSTKYVVEGKLLGQLGTEWNFPEAEREVSITSIPLFYYRVVGFYLRDRFEEIRFDSLSDLTNYRLGVIRGSSDAAIIKSSPSLKLNIEEVNRMDQLLKKVDAGRTDIAFMVELSGLYRIAALYPSERNSWKMSQDAIQGIQAHVVFSNEYPNTKIYQHAFAKGLQSIKENGTYTRIFEKYYGENQVPANVADIHRDIYTIPEKSQAPSQAISQTTSQDINQAVQ